MTPDQIIYTMISNLLCTIYTYYLPANIFYAYQNNYVVPKIDDFIILTRKNMAQNALPYWDFDITNQNQVYNGFGDWEYQVDLYGPNSDIAANLLFTYLNSGGGSNFLYLYPIQMGIGKVKEPFNLTKSNDRDQYMKRFTLMFTLLNVSNVTIPTAGINDSNIQIIVEQET